MGKGKIELYDLSNKTTKILIDFNKKIKISQGSFLMIICTILYKKFTVYLSNFEIKFDIHIINLS